jgi:hypothetical protein
VGRERLPSPVSVGGESALEAQQPLQIFPQDELFLLLGQALQA